MANSLDNTRPIEDELTARIAKLEAEREVYQRKLEAINVILKARQSGELAQSNNAN